MSPFFRPSCFPARVCAEKNWFTLVKRSGGPLLFYLRINVKTSANHCVSVYVLVYPCITFSNPFRGFVSTISKKVWAHQLVHSYGDSSEGLRLDVHFRMDCHTRIYLLKYSWTGALGHSEGSIAQQKCLSYSIF
jgi:hypothetical protein